MKILFSDFDGTLVDNHISISAKNIEMMKILQKQGHLVVICTGRNIKEFIAGMNKCSFPFDYAVLNNGGHIIDKNYQTLYEKMIDKDVGVDILKHTTSFDGLWSFFCDGKGTYGYMNGVTCDHSDGDRVIDAKFSDLYNQAKNFQIIAFNQDDEGLENTFECFDYIKKHYGHQVEAYLNTHYVDVVPKGCSKGTGVKKLLEIIGQDVEEVYAIGDSYNDLPMIEVADYGYTFVHASEEIKEKTHLHVHYVYEVIEDMLRGK